MRTPACSTRPSAPVTRPSSTAPAEADDRLTSPPDTVPWLASRLLGLGCEFEVHAPPELIGYLRAMAARASRAAGTGALPATWAPA